MLSFGNAHLLNKQRYDILTIKICPHIPWIRFYRSLNLFWITITLNFGRSSNFDRHQPGMVGYKGNLQSTIQLWYQRRLGNNRISS